MDDREYYEITNRTYTTPVKKPKINFSYKDIAVQQGKDDADMLLEKKQNWSSKKEWFKKSDADWDE